MTTSKNFKMTIENYSTLRFKSLWGDRLHPVDDNERGGCVYPGMLIKWPSVLDLGMILSVTYNNVLVMWCEVWDF